MMAFFTALLVVVVTISASSALPVPQHPRLMKGTFRSPPTTTTTTTTTTTPLTTTTEVYNFEPYFEETQRNLTVVEGQDAHFVCQVHNLGNYTVSWIRHRDIHILYVNWYPYSTEQRLRSQYSKDTGQSILSIFAVKKRDAGLYECQISTQPIKSYFIYLNVLDVLAGDEVTQHVLTHGDDIYHQMLADPVPPPKILGGPKIIIRKGDTINLTCITDYNSIPADSITWYHQNETINYDSKRGGVSIFTEKSNRTISYLLIQNATGSDAGKYSCSPSRSGTATIELIVNDASLCTFFANLGVLIIVAVIMPHI